MKYSILLLALGWFLANELPAQSFKTLYNFTATDFSGKNSDGSCPIGGLISSGGTLYGTAAYGGIEGGGTVFKLNADGTGFTSLHSFSAGEGIRPIYARLVLADRTLYGTTVLGGAADNGTVFAVNTDGTGFTTLYSFTAGSGTDPYITNSDGYKPGSLVSAGNTLYGVAGSGGSGGSGTIFVVNIDGTGFTTLHSFSREYPKGSFYTNSDGAEPSGDLILSGSTLYGVTRGGGSAGDGTVFKINIDGTGFMTLHSFDGGSFDGGGSFTNSDGASPWGGVVLSGSTLYGTTQVGGPAGSGTVFRLGTDGTGFMTLYSFSALSGGAGTNSDGIWPWGVTLLDNILYGTTYEGGSLGAGTAFAVKSNGAGFAALHSFAFSPDGDTPLGHLVLSGNTLYGTTEYGGINGTGTIFSISLPAPPPQLTIVPDGSGGYLIRAQGQPNFTCQLQRASSVTGPWTSSASQTASDAGVTEFHDLFPPPGHAFYRTVQQ